MLFEIATSEPGFAADEPTEQLGRALKLPAWEEPNRSAITAGLAVVLHPSMPPTDPHADEPLLSAGKPVADAAAVVSGHPWPRRRTGRHPGPAIDLERPELSWLAPSAAGRSWYPYRFISEKQQNQPYLDSALRRIATLVEQVRSGGIAHEKIVLLGFSQGACLASEFVARNPRRWGGLVVLSGGLIGPPGTTWDTPGSLAGTPVFVGCSDVDEHIPWRAWKSPPRSCPAWAATSRCGSIREWPTP